MGESEIVAVDLIQGFWRRSGNDPGRGPLREVRPHRVQIKGVETAVDIVLVPLDHAHGDIVLGDIMLIGPGESVQQLEGSACYIPVERPHDGGTQEPAIDTELDGVPGHLESARRRPQAGVDAPMPVIIGSDSLSPSGISRLKNRIVYELVIVNRS